MKTPLQLLLLSVFALAVLTPGLRAVDQAPTPPTATVPAAAQAQAQEIPLWPDGIPNAKPATRPETSRNANYTNVSNPRLIVYPPPTGTANGTAFIYSPGGGYSQIAGAGPSSISQWMNSLGVTVFVVLYRLEVPDYPAALQDELQAIRTVRARAKEFGLDPNRIGAGGGSAGAHLAGLAGIFYDDPVGKTGGKFDAVSARPDFLIMFFPVVTMDGPFVEKGSLRSLLGPNPTPELIAKMSLEKQVTKDMPPLFLVHTEQDTTSPIENSLMLFTALRNVGVPVEMHLYEKGLHSSGIYTSFGTTSTWPSLAEEWMRSHNWLPDAPNSLMYRGITALAAPAQGQPMRTTPAQFAPVAQPAQGAQPVPAAEAAPTLSTASQAARALP